MERRRRNPARFLAPIALVAVIVAGVMVIQNGRTSKSDGTSTATTQSDSSTTTTTASSKKSSKSSKKAKTYTVKPGDNLSTVAEKTGVSVEKIQELNPKLDAQNLQVGQKIKLSGSGGSTTTP